MDSEPVKVKMTLRRAQPSIQGATTTPAAAAAVEAVEARWRAEEKKEKTEKRKKRLTGCLSWIIILLAAAGGAWYFAGDRFLPPEYTFPSVWQKIKEWQSPPPSRPEQPNPVDIRTAAERGQMKAFVANLGTLCELDLRNAKKGVNVRTDAWPIGESMLKDIVSADGWYFKSRQKLDAMVVQNENLDKKRGEGSNIQYINQNGSRSIDRQQSSIDKQFDDCKRARVQAVQRAIKAIQARSSHWTGPESKRDVSQFIARLDGLSRKLAGL